jgi:hypothetical protein
MEENDENPGGGSGGDDGSEDRGHRVISADGTYAIRANQVSLVSWKNIPPSTDNESRIILLAGGGLDGAFIDDGTVDIRGCNGVRVTSGPVALPDLSPPVSSDSTNGVEIIASEAQNVTIQRGLIPDVDQQIVMSPGSIVVDGGTGTVTIQSLTQVTLSVAGGASSITLTPEGITIQGLQITVQGEAMVGITGTLVTIN